MIRRPGSSVDAPVPLPEKEGIQRPATAPAAAPVSPPTHGASVFVPAASPANPTALNAGLTARTDGPAPQFTDPIMGSGANSKIPEARPQLLPEQKNILSEQLKNPNFFGELDAFPASAKQVLAPAGERFRDLMSKADQNFFSGRRGRLNAARFVDREFRTDGDFRYALGREAYRAWTRADARLQMIPLGELGASLTLALLSEVHALAYVPADAKPNEKFQLAVRRQLLHSETGAGRLRTYEQLPLPSGKLSEGQLADLEAVGMRVRWVPNLGKDLRRLVFYPRVEEVQPLLEAALERTRRELADPNADPFDVAARFVRAVMSKHPFSDGNGRLVRLFRDRIVEEFGFAPPLMRTTDDLLLTHEQLTEEIRQGSARMQEALRVRIQPAREDQVSAMFTSRGHALLNLGAVDGRVLTLDDGRFALGMDGFVTDEAGRPYLLDPDGTLAPLGQWTYYFLMRRLANAADGPARTDALTRPTREAFARWAQDPAAAAQVKVLSDLEAIAHDNKFRVWLRPDGNQAYLEHFDPARVGAERLFTPIHKPKGKRDLTFTLSKYDQLDLELWHVQRALEKVNDEAGLRQLQGYRSALFQMARDHFAAQVAAKGSSLQPEPPYGLTLRSEVIQYERSPLRFPSLDAFQARHGDDTLTLWRGDTFLAELTGVHADSVIGRPDARTIEKGRNERQGAADHYGRLKRVSGASGGTGYQSYTTDLGLLISSFASISREFSVQTAALPPLVRTFLEDRLDEPASASIGTFADAAFWLLEGGVKAPEGKLDVSGIEPEVLEAALREGMRYLPTVGSTDLIAELKTRIRSAHAAAQAQGSTPIGKLNQVFNPKPMWIDIGDLIEQPSPRLRVAALTEALRSLVTMKKNPETGAISVAVHQRAYGLEVKKKWAIPGISTVGGAFEGEQEVHVARSQMPHRVFGRWTATELSTPVERTR